MNSLFAIRGELSKRTSVILQVSGVLLLLTLWTFICATGLVPSSILPSPIKVLGTFPELHYEDAMVRNLGYSLYLNTAGYLEAVAICLPLGFMVGMFPIFDGLFSKQVDSIRFIPLTAITGLFMSWFGLEDTMKVQFLAFGITVYLLPVVVQRVREAPMIYQQTAFTLGASRWQIFTTVFFPYVKSKIVLDVKVLVAISWTYVIVAEMVNNTGGIGAMMFLTGRNGQISKTFALLFVIIIVGYIQDKLFLVLDRILSLHKYE
jgi:NitT/TauT family transport system permease protein